MEQLLNYAMDIGEEMLVSGAEVHRVEESVKRMCLAFGATRTDVFIITSSMVVTVFITNKTFTQTRRITKGEINFEKLHKLNQLSRRICDEGLKSDEISNILEKIKQTKKNPFWLECICYAVIAAVFSLFFGGSINDMFVSLFIGAVVRLGIEFSNKLISNKIFQKFFSSVLVTFLAFLALNIGFANSVDKIIIGNIMTLIPGIGLTNALRDLFTGDSIAGLLRSIEVVLTALAIAAGYFLVVTIGGIII